MSGMTEEQRVGDRLSALRKAAGLTQEQLADKMRGAGHPWWQPTVSKVEAGRRAVPSDEMAVLAGILAAPLDWAVAA
jgi:transcriptional regulator with XRE-family HTH domain